MKSNTFKIGLVIFFMLSSIITHAQTTTGQNGPGDDLWTDGLDSWDNGQPACGSHTDIVIPDGVTIIIRNTDIDLSACDVSITIESGGTLRFGSNNGNTSSLTLGENSTITLESGAAIRANINGTSTGPEITITIGTNETWDGSDGDITDEGTMDKNTVDGALPIALLAFSAYKEVDHIKIEWSTSWEFNNDYFMIERSSNGLDFYDLKKVEGAGLSNEILNYSVIDYSPLSGMSYYRLRQTDFDGRSEVFNVVSVETGGSITHQFRIYPNPAIDFITVIAEGTVVENLEIFNMAGTKIRIPPVYKVNEGRIVPLDGIISGIYFIKSGNHMARFIKE